MIEVDETVDLVPASDVLLPLLRLANVSTNGTRRGLPSVGCQDRLSCSDISLASLDQRGAGAEVLAGHSQTITIMLTEEQRIQAMKISDRPGGDRGGGRIENGNFGDGVPVVLDVYRGAFRDLVSNNVSDTFNVTVNEVPDTLLPRIVAAQMHYGTGVLQLFCSETIDVTPASLHVNLNKWSISNFYGEQYMPLGGASVGEVDGNEFNITLTEQARVVAIAISAVPGGDTVAAVLDVYAGGFKDMAGNVNADDVNNILIERADTIKPRIKSAKLNYTEGTLEILASETIDLTPTCDERTHCVNLTKIFLTDVTGLKNISMDGATVTAIDDTSVHLRLTEKQRVVGIAMSGTSGGDGEAVVLDVYANAVMGIGENWNDDELNRTVLEAADVWRPHIKGASTRNVRERREWAERRARVCRLIPHVVVFVFLVHARRVLNTFDYL